MGDVIVERHGRHVLTCRLNQPDKGNAITGTVQADLHRAADAADRDDEIRVLLLGAVGPFSVGADLGELEHAHGAELADLFHDGIVGGDNGLEDFGPQRRQLDPVGMGRLTARLRSLDVPIVAAIDGAAVGGGFALAMMADLRVATAGARLGTGFLRVGLGSELGLSWLLPRVVGPTRAAELLLLAETIDGIEAERMGLVNRVVDNADDLWPMAIALAEELAAMPPLAVVLTNRLLRATWDMSLDEALRQEWTNQQTLFGTDDFAEGVAAIRARRVAEWKGL